MQRIRNITKTMSHDNNCDINRSAISGKDDEACTKNETKREERVTGCFCLGYRHLVALYSFFYFGMVNTHLSTISITIVAMVNHTQVSLPHTKNISVLSCPIPDVPEHVTHNPRLPGTFFWDSQVQGLILGLNTAGYLISNFFAGRIGEIFGAKKTLIIADFLLNICAILSPTAANQSPYALLVAQIGRGFFQGFTIPCVFILMANWFPRGERGLLASFSACGSSFWSCVSGLIIGKLCDVPSMRWPSVFYVVGGFNMLVTLSFAFFTTEVPKLHPHISKAELEYITGDQESDMSLKRPPAPWKAIFTSIPVYALAIGKIGYFWSNAHFVFMHPTYMGTVLHFSMTENGLFTCMLFFIMTVSCVITMTASFQLRKRNILSVNSLRKGCSSLSAFGFCLCLVGVCFAGCDVKLNRVFCGLAIFCGGIGVCGTMIANGDMSPKFSGSLSGMTSAVACLGPLISPMIVGAITKHETLEEWHSVFYMHIAVIATCGIIFQVFGSAEIQPFDSVTAPEEQTNPAIEIKTVFKPDSNCSTTHM